MGIQRTDELDGRIARLESALERTQRDAEALRAAVRQARRAGSVSKIIALTATTIAVLSTVSTLTLAEGGLQRVVEPFIVVNRQGKEIARIEEGPNGGVVDVSNQSGKSVASIWSDQTGRGNLTVSDAQGRERFRAFVDDRDGGGFGVYGRNGNLMADLLEGDAGGRGMYIYNKDGTAVVRVVARSDGGGQITAGEAKKQSGFITSEDRNTIQLVDRSGQLVWAATDKSPATDTRGFWLFDASGNVRLVGYVDEKDTTYLALGKGKTDATVGMTDDDGGKLMAGIRDNAKPTFAAFRDGAYIYNESGVAEVGLTYSNQGGILAIGNSAGDTMVDAGVLANGRGVVRAYPLGGATPIPIPHFIEGRSAESK